MKIHHLLLSSAFVLSACMPTGGLPGLIDGAVNADGSASSSASADASGSASANANASVSVGLPNPLEIASVSGLKASSCSEEASLRSINSDTASRVNFKNNSEGRIKIYWLNNQGQRVEYKVGGLASGQTHQQNTFVTHPWLITNEQGQCLGIYTPENSGAVSLDINKTVTVSGGGTTSGSSNTSVTGNLSAVTEANITEARARQGVDCLRAKGDRSNATTVEAGIGLYAQMKGVVGEGIAKQGYLAPMAKILIQHGC